MSAAYYSDNVRGRIKIVQGSTIGCALPPTTKDTTQQWQMAIGKWLNVAMNVVGAVAAFAADDNDDNRAGANW